MKWSSMQYLTTQGLSSMRANRFMTAAGIGVLTVCLMLTGAAVLFTWNVQSLVDYLGSQNETVVYLNPLLSNGEMGLVYDEILAVDGVQSAEFVSKQEVLSTYSGYLDEYSEVWEDFEQDNPFKANYRVVIHDLARIQEISDAMARIDGVYKVVPPVELAEIFIDVQRVVNIVGYILVAVLGIVSMVVIGNTIRLSVHARKMEIMIMKYVGATNAFIRWPFFVEGVAVGVIAANIAAFCVICLYITLTYEAKALNGFWGVILHASIVPVRTIAAPLCIGFLVSGIVIGGLGSLFSIRKHLDV